MFEPAIRKIGVYLFAVKAVFVWLVVGAGMRRRYRACIRRGELFYLDEELGGPGR